MSALKWEILCLTQPSRVEYFDRLKEVLVPQLRRGVGLTASYFSREFGEIGENRQRMVERSSAEYISFVDDDDLVSKDYVEKILPLLDGVDMVGFNVECYTDGRFIALARHSLDYHEWLQVGTELLRDLSYMTPMRRELVLKAPIEGSIGEDRRWAARLRKLQVVWTQHYLDETMYYYYFRSQKQDGVTA